MILIEHGLLPPTNRFVVAPAGLSRLFGRLTSRSTWWIDHFIPPVVTNRASRALERLRPAKNLIQWVGEVTFKARLCFRSSPNTSVGWHNVESISISPSSRSQLYVTVSS